MNSKALKMGRKRYAARRRAIATRALQRPEQPQQPGIDPAVVTDLQAKVDSSARENAGLRDSVARQRADFDNFRRRTMKEKEQIRDTAREEIMFKLLAVLDNFERARIAAETAADAKSIQDGISMVYAQLQRLVEAEGLQRIESKDAVFNPNEHEALATEERTDVEENHVCEEMLPGYRYKDKVIRPAMVKVAKAPAEVAEA